MLDAYVRYLAAERGLSEATVTAYTADVAGLLDHLVRFTGAGRSTASNDLTLTVLRSWLARLRTTGAARASLARRAAAGRSFTAWAHRTGWLDSDVGARLASPKGGRTLPSVLRVDQATEMLLPVESRAKTSAPGLGHPAAAAPSADSSVETSTETSTETSAGTESAEATAIAQRDQAILDTPVPAGAFAALMLERYQIGCAFFVDQREHRYTPEERALFPGFTGACRDDLLREDVQRPRRHRRAVEDLAPDG